MVLQTNKELSQFFFKRVLRPLKMQGFVSITNPCLGEVRVIIVISREDFKLKELGVHEALGNALSKARQEVTADVTLSGKVAVVDSMYCDVNGIKTMVVP